MVALFGRDHHRSGGAWRSELRRLGLSILGSFSHLPRAGNLKGEKKRGGGGEHVDVDGESNRRSTVTEMAVGRSKDGG
ncbi:hypothetical protein V6N13_041680 [Hibiscus sabdariffa]